MRLKRSTQSGRKDRGRVEGEGRRRGVDLAWQIGESDQQEIGADSAFILISAGTIGRQRRHAAVES